MTTGFDELISYLISYYITSYHIEVVNHIKETKKKAKKRSKQREKNNINIQKESRKKYVMDLIGIERTKRI